MGKLSRVRRLLRQKLGQRLEGVVAAARGKSPHADVLYRLEAQLIEAQNAAAQARADYERLRGAFEVLPEPVILFDADDRVVMWNRLYAENSSLAQGHGDGRLRPGLRFEETIRMNLERRLFPEAEGREEEWLAQRLERHARATSTHEQQLAGGRWVRLEERRTPDGGNICMRVDVTDLKRREASFRLLFDDNPVPMCVFDQETLQFLAVNQVMADSYGYSREQFLAMSLLDVTPPEQHAEAVAAIARMGDKLHSGRTWRHIRADGSEIHIASYSRRIEYHGHHARMAAVVDVTDRVNAADDLRRNREFLEQIIDNVPLSITVKDANDLRFVMLNRTAEEYWGVPRTEAIGKTARQLFGEEQAQRVTDRDHAALRADGPIYLGEHSRVGRGNEDRTFSSRRVAIRDDEGRPTFVVGVMEDVTERKRAEDDRRRTQAFLDAVIENVPATLFVKEPNEHRYVLLNRAGERMLGVSRDEIIGKNDYDLLTKDEAEISFARDRDVLESKTRLDRVDEGQIVTAHNGTRLVTTKRVAILDDDQTPQYLLGVVEDITDRKLAEERIEHLAYCDGLTDLPNRSAFNARLMTAIEAARKDDSTFALMFLDLDRFKEINDVYGHATGDALLIEVAQRLTKAADGAFVARLGGDEFTLIVEGPQPAASTAIANRVIAELGDDVVVGDKRLRTGVTLGIAVFPADGDDISTLLGNADAALYRAKAEARGSIRFYEAEMDLQLRERRALQHDLQAAIGTDQITLNYQPQCRLDGEITGFEALVRWKHPARGMVSPATFIPIAEESGLIIPLGEWVLREACREAASWPKPLQIAVNLSPMQFHHGNLPDLVHTALFESGLSAPRLELEITEGVLIDDFARALSILRRLKLLGIRIAMDDFGTGYSSLSCLQSFPFDKIKIDQTFIANLDTNPQSAAIVRAVIGLARGLGLPVVAEGVETRDQLDFLSRESCDEIQGYLFGRPLPIDNYSEPVGRQPATAAPPANGRRGVARAASTH